MIPFVKMHGLGNDFVIFDARETPLSLTAENCRRIADRRHGVGCDQIIVLKPARNDQADLFMHIYNSDGSEAEACGNATRCVGAKIMAEKNNPTVLIESLAGLLKAQSRGSGKITVDMGSVRLSWDEIPLRKEVDTLHLPIAEGELSDPVGVNVGNPHMVFLVEDITRIDLERLGPLLESHPLYPQKANVEIAQILPGDKIRVRVFERGAGITLACGSGACATLIAAVRRGLMPRKAEILLDGGSLWIEWLDNNHVEMTGGWTESFRGTIDLGIRAS